MITAVEHAKLLPLCQDLTQADLALCIVLSIVMVIGCGAHVLAFLVSESARRAIATSAALIVNADALGGSRLVAIEELFDACIIFIIVIAVTLVKLAVIEVHRTSRDLLRADHPNNTDLSRNRVISKDDTLSNFTLWQFVVVLEVVRVVVVTLRLLHVRWMQHRPTHGCHHRHLVGVVVRNKA